MYELGLMYIILYPVLLFVSLGRYKSSWEVLLVILTVILASIMFSSRVHLMSESDDIIRYYHAYLQAGNYSLTQYIEVINREVLYVGGNWFLYQLLGDISSRLYLFLTSLIFNVFFSIALLKFFSEQRYKLFIIVGVLFIPSISMHTQLVRQALAFSILLLYITSDKEINKFLLFVVAMAIHKIIILFFILLWSYKYCNKLVLKPVVLFSVPVICFLFGKYININEIVSLLQLIPSIGNKALYLSNIELSPLSLGLVSIISIFMYLLMTFRAERLMLVLSEKEQKLLYLIFFILCFCLLFAFFSQISTRFMFFFLIFFPWFCVLSLSMYVQKKDKKFFFAIIYCLFILLFVRNLTVKYSAFSLFDGELTDKSISGL